MDNFSTDDGLTRVGFAGDWHGSAAWAGRAIPAMRRAGVRTIYHVGDLGLYENDPFLKTLDYWLQDDMTLVCTPGNHEQWSWLNGLWAVAGPGQPAQVANLVWALPRGYRSDHAGRQYLSVRGTPSIDRGYRRAVRRPWDACEAITEEDIERITAEGGGVDIMITHDAPDRGTEAVRRARVLNEDPQFRPDEEDVEYAIEGVQRLTHIYESVLPQVHGHYHRRDEAVVDGWRIYSMGKDGDRAGNLAVLDLGDMAWEWLSVNADKGGR